jgi:peptidoglycan/xylan/chitin deacetylase (PgdA/CDA1 family)
MTTLPVLMYHSISDVARGPAADMAVPGPLLAEQLAALAGAGYRLMGLTDALTAVRRRADARVVALTFDDGFRDFLTEALPVLAAASANATLYQAVGHTGREASWMGPAAGDFSRLLTWSELRTVAAAGVEIGSHGMVHHPLDVLPRRQVEVEVRTSREMLRQKLQVPVASFAYPHGYHSGAVRAAVARCGHVSACEVGRRLYHPPAGPPRGPARASDTRRARTVALAIPRLHVTRRHSGEDVVRLVRDGGSRLEPLVKHIAGPGWRVVRRFARDTLGVRLT